MIVLFIANVILLVILLIGLFHLLRSGDVFSLWRVLWKQVSMLVVILAGLSVLYPDSFLRSLGRLLPICCYGRRATSSGKSTRILLILFCLFPFLFDAVGTHIFGFEQYYSFSLQLCRMLIELDPALDVVNSVRSHLLQY